MVSSDRSRAPSLGGGEGGEGEGGEGEGGEAGHGAARVLRGCCEGGQGGVALCWRWCAASAAFGELGGDRGDKGDGRCNTRALAGNGYRDRLLAWLGVCRGRYVGGVGGWWSG